MSHNNLTVQKSFANGHFRETTNGDYSPSPFCRSYRQHGEKRSYYSPLFRRQVKKSRDRENSATLRTVLKKRCYFSRRTTTADEDVDENFSTNVRAGTMNKVWRQMDDDSSGGSSTPSLGGQKRKASWWAGQPGVDGAPSKISKKCLDDDATSNDRDFRGGILSARGPINCDHSNNIRRPGGLQFTGQAGFDFLTTFTEQISKSMNNELNYEELLNHTQQVFKQRYEDVLLNSVRDTPHTDHEKLLNILRQSWNHSMVAVVKACAQKMSFWSMTCLSVCTNVIPSGVFASIFAAKLSLCQRAVQSTTTPDSDSPSTSSESNVISADSSATSSHGSVFRHKVIFCDNKPIFCLRCGPTNATVFCKTCQEKEKPEDGEISEANTHTWCLNPDCLADYENNGEIVCLTMAYCTLCKLPLQKDIAQELRDGMCTCLIDDFPAEFFERDLSIPDD